MAVSKNSTVKKIPAKNIAGVRSNREKFLRVLVVLLVLLAAGGAVLFGVFGLKRLLFTGNARFNLRSIEVLSGGYWQERSGELAGRLGIRLGDNLFRLRPGELRRRLEAIPSIESGEVIRVLPDTLQLKVVERIPRAVLGSVWSPWVIDETALVMPRNESMNVSTPLPVIFFRTTGTLAAGMELEMLRPALELIMLTVRSFPDITIKAVSMRHPQKLEFYMSYRDQKSCKVLMPHDGDFTFLLEALQSAIIQAAQRGDSRGNFDLRYDGYVIIN